MRRVRYNERKFKNEGFTKKNEAYELADLEEKNALARKEAKLYKVKKLANKTKLAEELENE